MERTPQLTTASSSNSSPRTAGQGIHSASPTEIPSPSTPPSQQLQSAQITNSHSICFRYHPGVPETIHPRSSVLPRNIACYPAMWRDNSKEQIEELQARKKAHNELLTKDPTVFHRKAGETNEHFRRLHSTRHLLNSIHVMSDPHDIVPHKYTFSRLPKTERSDLSSSMQDFLQPNDPLRPRSSGYSSSLLRSMMQLDTFGPIHSSEVSAMRSKGELPQSPIIDRNRHLWSDHTRISSVTPETLSTNPNHSKPFSPFNSEYQIASQFFEYADPRTKGKTWYRGYVAEKKVILRSLTLNSAYLLYVSGIRRETPTAQAHSRWTADFSARGSGNASDSAVI